MKKVLKSMFALMLCAVMAVPSVANAAVDLKKDVYKPYLRQCKKSGYEVYYAIGLITADKKDDLFVKLKNKNGVVAGVFTGAKCRKIASAEGPTRLYLPKERANNNKDKKVNNNGIFALESIKVIGPGITKMVVTTYDSNYFKTKKGNLPEKTKYVAKYEAGKADPIKVWKDGERVDAEDFNAYMDKFVEIKLDEYIL